MSRSSQGKNIRNDSRDRDYIPSNLVDNDSNHHTNGEEDDARHNRKGYRNFIANYTKGLHHYPIADPQKRDGEVFINDYEKMLDIINSCKIDGIPKGTDNDPCGRKQTNPLSGLAFDFEGADSHSFEIPPPPRIDSKEGASEMAELYWMALCRDIPFTDYQNDFNTNGLIKNAVDDLKTYHDYTYPTPIGPQTIFRGFTNGDLIGPYVSQFLLRGNNIKLLNLKEEDGFIQFGTLVIDQRQSTVNSKDYVLKYNANNPSPTIHTWLNIQNGSEPRGISQNGMCIYRDDCAADFKDRAQDKRGYFIRNLRDLTHYVHFDDLPQEFLNACLILKHLGVPNEHGPACAPQPHGPVAAGNPYLKSKSEEAFSTFGDQYILTLVAEVARRALNAAWYQKWYVHRRLRPEAFGGLIHRQLNHDPRTPPPIPDPNLNAPNPPYPIHEDILKIGSPGGTQTVLDRIYSKNHSYLLPQAYPEGSTLHPSYTSGHATISGACVTVLKAYFKEDATFDKSYQSDSTGTMLVDATNLDGTPLTSKLKVRDELNKLASNIALARNAAGIHYRSDYTQGLLLGEQVAIRLLCDQLKLYCEPYCFSFTSFNNEKIYIGTDCDNEVICKKFERHD